MSDFTRPLLVSAVALAIALAPTTAWGSTDVSADDGASDTVATSPDTVDPDTVEPAIVDPPPVATDSVVSEPAAPPATDPAPEPAPGEAVETPESAPGDSEPLAGQPAVAAEEEPGGGHDEGEGGHGEGGTLPDGVVVTVDGRDISASDPGGSLPMIAGCAFDITATGLTATPPDTVGVRVVAWPPTATEESRPVLVDVTETSADGSWAGVFAVDEAVQQFDRSPNGYHMRLEIFINGQKGAMKMYWLGCGEPQTGDPRRMLFDVEWMTYDGTPLTGDLDQVLPAGWRQDFRLAASGDRGTVGCWYPRGTDVLSCTYDNPGHGDDPGLVLPGSPGTSYRVSVTGVPRGWTVDAETIGVFLADDTCPKGHGDEGEEAAEAAEEGPKEPCLHMVTVTGPFEDQQGGGSADPPTASDPSGDDAAAPGAAQLAATGTNGVALSALAIGAAAMVAFGTLAVRLARRESEL